jgi:hypothetical protein
MKLVDAMVRMVTPVAVAGASLLREELRQRGITVPLTDAFVRELVADAVNVQGALPEEIARRAEFLQQWTQTDDRVDADDLSRRLTRLALKHAVPRPWRLTVPVAVESRHPTPTYLKWASAAGR